MSGAVSAEDLTSLIMDAFLREEDERGNPSRDPGSKPGHITPMAKPPAPRPVAIALSPDAFKALRAQDSVALAHATHPAGYDMASDAVFSFSILGIPARMDRDLDGMSYRFVREFEA